MDRISIRIDCDEDKDEPCHWLTVGDKSYSYSNEADLADHLDMLLEGYCEELAA